MRNAKFGLLFTLAIPARLFVLISKTCALVITIGVEKSMKVVPFVEYWSREYLLPVLLAR